MTSLIAFNALDRQLRKDVAIDRAVSKRLLPVGHYWCRLTKSALSMEQIKQLCDSVNARYVIDKNRREVELYSGSKPDITVFGV